MPNCPSLFSRASVGSDILLERRRTGGTASELEGRKEREKRKEQKAVRLFSLSLWRKGLSGRTGVTTISDSRPFGCLARKLLGDSTAF